MLVREEARAVWDAASRKAFWNQLLSNIGGGQQSLLDFNEIARHLRLRTEVYRGLQSVPLAKIVGSVGRYQDFTGAFLPISQDMRDRWQRVASLYLDPTSGGPPPVDLYKVGDSYFVKDGNHRVSVANQLGLTDIEAYVWEYPAPVNGQSEDLAIDDLLLEAERQDFLTETRLDELRPNHTIRLTEPGGYLELLGQIARYQEVLSQIDGEPVSYEEAVKAWYDMIYETSIQIIEDAGVLKLFPERTPADFFVWMMRAQSNLQERYGRRERLADIVQKLPDQQRPGWFSRLRAAVLRVLTRWLAD